MKIKRRPLFGFGFIMMLAGVLGTGGVIFIYTDGGFDHLMASDFRNIAFICPPLVVAGLLMCRSAVTSYKQQLS